MSTRCQNRWLIVAFIGLLVSGWWLTRVAESQQPQIVNIPTKWEYNTVNLEVGGLEAKLGELALAGWEVFSIAHTETALTQGGAEPKLVVQKLQITSKRRTK